MPFKGADLTSSTLQATANPSSKWNSTYHSMYQNPLKYGKRQDYWLKRGMKRTELLKQKTALEKSSSTQTLHYNPAYERPSFRTSQALGASIPLQATTIKTRRSEGSYVPQQQQQYAPLSPARQDIFESSPLYPADGVRLDPRTLTPNSFPQQSQSMRRSQSLPAALSVRPSYQPQQQQRYSPSQQQYAKQSHTQIVYEPEDEYEPQQQETYGYVNEEEQAQVYEPVSSPPPQPHINTQAWIRPSTSSAAYRSSAPIRTHTQPIQHTQHVAPVYEPYPLYQQTQLRAHTPYSSSQQLQAHGHAWQ